MRTEVDAVWVSVSGCVLSHVYMFDRLLLFPHIARHLQWLLSTFDELAVFYATI